MTSDLEKEARAAADDWMETLPDSSDIGNTETHVDDAYEAGYLAAAEPREKEIEALLAKLEAVPPFVITALEQFCGAYDGPGSKSWREDVRRWLAGLK